MLNNPELSEATCLAQIRADAVELASNIDGSNVAEHVKEKLLPILNDVVPFVQGLHDDWALFYYMCTLSCSTVIVTFDEQWLKSPHAEGEWHLFARHGACACAVQCPCTHAV